MVPNFVTEKVSTEAQEVIADLDLINDECTDFKWSQDETMPTQRFE